jgi:preprotein translocase subunit SecY
VLIFAGIVIDIPGGVAQLVEMNQVGSVSGFMVLGLLVWFVLTMGFVCFVESSERRLPLKNPAALSQAKQGRIDFSQESYLPFKVNAPGVMPVIFASTVLSMAVWVFSQYPDSAIAVTASTMLSAGHIVRICIYAAIIFALAFLFASVMFDTKEQAENLKRSGNFIPGIRPGKPTQMYFDHLLTLLTTIGGAYLVLVCVIPEFMAMANVSLVLTMGGTSALIMASVGIGIFDNIKKYLKEQIQADLMSKHTLRKGPKRKVQR